MSLLAERHPHAFLAQIKRRTDADNPAADDDDIDFGGQAGIAGDSLDLWSHSGCGPLDAG
jgi:hypothetical protein